MFMNISVRSCNQSVAAVFIRLGSLETREGRQA